MHRSVEGVLLLCFKSKFGLHGKNKTCVWECEVHKNLRYLCVYNPIHTKVHLSLLPRNMHYMEYHLRKESLLRLI